MPSDPQCRIDRDCPSQMSCIDENCVNLCASRNPCQGNLECSVSESHGGTRTVACSCPQGYVAVGLNRCEQGNVQATGTFLLSELLNNSFFSFLVQVQPQCRVHDDCGDAQICHQGSCQNACRFQSCGVNAICTAQNHVARCECLTGYFGENPNVGCRTSKCMNDIF